MATGEITNTFFVYLKLGFPGGGGSVINSKAIRGFEWKSFVNGGYEIKATITDPGHQLLNRLKILKQTYLAKARKEPLEVYFKIGYHGGKEYETNLGKPQKAIVSDLIINGDATLGQIEFVAIDPPSWYLNAGQSDGKVYTGNISKVIKDMISEKTGGAITANVSETKDDKNGKWGMMRQDPKAFIGSLLSWTPKISKNDQSSWLVGVDDDVIYIQDQIDSLQRKKHIGDYNSSPNTDRRNDIYNYTVLNQSLLTVYQNRMVTQGISTVSGKFIDKQTEPDKAEIKDDNTSEKLNTRINQYMSFDKSDKDYSTSLISIPELNGGELGLNYEDWIGGKPQQSYVSMLPMIMRCRVALRGDYRFYDNHNLGVSTIKLTWKDVNGDDFYLHGHWIVYGFRHRMLYDGQDDLHWWTDAYIYRIDYNAEARTIP